jgi:hypothetical protein
LQREWREEEEWQKASAIITEKSVINFSEERNCVFSTHMEDFY